MSFSRIIISVQLFCLGWSMCLNVLVRVAGVEYLNPGGATGGRKGSLERTKGSNEVRHRRAFWRMAFEARLLLPGTVDLAQ